MEPRTCRFNPTRVRLEPSVWSGVSSVCPASTPQGFVWNTVRRVERVLRGASTPQGFVWNAFVVFDPCLEEGASTPQGFVWNHALGIKQDLGWSASTPQGFVWNSLAGSIAVPSVQASTPQGFVWNSLTICWSCSFMIGFNPTRVRLEHQSRLLASGRVSSFNPTRVRLERTPMSVPRATRFCFNPTRVRLELYLAPCPDGKKPASTPQGFVWNAIGHLPADRLHVASTPQGFVWNNSPGDRSMSLDSLQPHKGSSGTDSRETARRRRWRFNPTRVRLERVTLRRSRPAWTSKSTGTSSGSALICEELPRDRSLV